MSLDPDTLNHFMFHRSLLLNSGIVMDIDYVVAQRIGIRVQQIADLDAIISAEELQERTAAVFRFLPYIPVIRVIPANVDQQSRQ